MQIKIFTIGLNPIDIKDGERVMNEFMSTVNVEKVSERYIMQQTGPSQYIEHLYVFVYYSEAKAKAEKVEKGERESHRVKQFSEEQKSLLSALKVWRKEKATELGKQEAEIIPNYALEMVTASHPRNALALSSVSGINKSIVASHGDDIIAICNAF